MPRSLRSILIFLFTFVLLLCSSSTFYPVSAQMETILCYWDDTAQNCVYKCGSGYQSLVSCEDKCIDNECKPSDCASIEIQCEPMPPTSTPGPSPTRPPNFVSPTPTPPLPGACGNCNYAFWSSGGWNCWNTPGIYLCSTQGYCCPDFSICTSCPVRPTGAPVDRVCSSDQDCINDYQPGYGFDTYWGCLIDGQGRIYCGGQAYGPFRHCDSSGNPTPFVTTSIYTGLGCLDFSGKVTIQSILNWAVGLSGGISLIFIALAAIQLIFAGGDPGKLQAGRELLNASLTGLGIIVLCIVLLNFIGVTVLGLPNFRL